MITNKKLNKIKEDIDNYEITPDNFDLLIDTAEEYKTGVISDEKLNKIKKDRDSNQMFLEDFELLVKNSEKALEDN